MSSRAGLGLLLLIPLYWFVQGPFQLGFRPVVYHDEAIIYDISLSVLEHGRPSQPLFDARPETVEVLGGEGRLHIAIAAGYHYLIAAWTALTGPGATRARLPGSLAALVVALLLLRLGHRLSGSWTVGALAATWWILDASINQAARTMRPDVPTAAAYLAAACVALEAGRRAPGRLAAGLLLGLGLTMHPVGAVSAPGVLFFAWAGRDEAEPWPRTLLPLLAGAALPLLLYAGLLASAWDDVQIMLALHAEHRILPDLSYPAHLWAFLSGQYQNRYTMTLGLWRPLVLCLGVATAAALALAGSRLGPGVGRRLRPAVLACLAALLALPLLGRDYFNFLYLSNVFPWVFLAGALGLHEGLCALARRRWAPRPALPLTVVGVLWGLAGLYAYGVDAERLHRAGVASYDAVSQALALSVAPGSYVLGTPNASHVTRAADAIYLHNDVYFMHRPDYERYPVAAERDGSHLLSYRLQPDVLERLRGTGRPVYFHMDMWDWGWNAYWPWGRRYAASFAQLRADLERYFALRAVAFTFDRGRVELWEYAGPDAPPAFYDEDRPVELGPPLASPVTFPAGATIAALRDQPLQLASVATRPGERYWLRAWIRCEGTAVGHLALDGVSLSRWFDAAVAVPFDHVHTARGERLDVSLLPNDGEGHVVVERLEVRPVVPSSPR